MSFDPTKYLIKLSSGQLYLPVNARIAWFRSEHPDWVIETEKLESSEQERSVIFRCQIRDAEGRLLATAHAKEYGQKFFAYFEKAETAAIGRALAVLGYGTLYALEISEDQEAHGEQPVDAPIASASATAGGKAQAASSASATETKMIRCKQCGVGMNLTKEQFYAMKEKFGAPLCPRCQDKKLAESALSEEASF